VSNEVCLALHVCHSSSSLKDQWARCRFFRRKQSIAFRLGNVIIKCIVVLASCRRRRDTNPTNHSLSPRLQRVDRRLALISSAQSRDHEQSFVGSWREGVKGGSTTALAPVEVGPKLCHTWLNTPALSVCKGWSALGTRTTSFIYAVGR
jgi:hypothetical protein